MEAKLASASSESLKAGGLGRVRFGKTLGTIPARALPAFLVEAVRDFEQWRRKDELFEEYFERCGMDHFRPLLGRHAEAPPYEVAPEYYRDWGSEGEFSLAGRGAGECGAGVFEVVAEDITAARKALEQAGKAGAGEEDIYRALLATVRVLVITRGVDSQKPEEIFKAFATPHPLWPLPSRLPDMGLCYNRYQLPFPLPSCVSIPF